MLEVKNLVKVYKTKGGVETRALDGVTVNFPETGLVFLLGKSGSGKSTLLNMIGGLDRPDGGEIIVKGRSSKDFSQSDFDSYRNTYIGFIFQEYNVLNEFNVEQNIALALQLQGKKNDREAVNALLKEVDLEGFNKRKPNTLSGGQKQRIAIARALIKSPEIIMADEPTGALDSNTGKQVLETLKKLSKDKLVIVVSHDQDFAEEYGDRIIELKDGKIISDKSKEHVPPKAVNNNIQIINGNIIDIKKGNQLTEADFKQLYQLIKKQDKEVLISTGDNNIAVTKKAQRISEDGKGEVFKDTNEVKVKQYDGKQTKFIRSHMPFSRSFKMGASSLKTKPIRLIFTILLSVVSFTMFGVASTLMLYNPAYSLSDAMKSVDRTSEAITKKYSLTSKSVTINNKTGQVEKEGSESTNEAEGFFGVQELKDLNAQNNNRFFGVYTLLNSSFSLFTRPFQFQNVMVTDDSKEYYSHNGFAGLTDMDASYISTAGHLTGAHPAALNELAISNYHFDLLKQSGAFGALTDYNSILNKELSISFNGKNWMNYVVKMKIVGVYDFGAIPTSYNDVKTGKEASQSQVERQKRVDAFDNFIASSVYTIGYVSPAFYETYGYVPSNSRDYLDTVWPKGILYNYSREAVEEQSVSSENSFAAFLYEDVSAMKSGVTYYDTDFKEVSSLSINENEVLLPYSHYYMESMRYKYWDPINNYYWKINNNRNILHQDDIDLLQELDQMNEEESPNALVAAYRRMRSYFEMYKGNGYPAGHTLEEDYQTVINGFNTYYQKICARRYLQNSFYRLENYYNEKAMEKPANWEENRVIVEHFQENGITDAQVTSLKTYLNDRYNEQGENVKYILRYLRAELLTNMANDSLISKVYDYAREHYGEGMDYNKILMDYVDSPTNPTYEARFLNVYDYAYKLVKGEQADSSVYEFDPSFLGAYTLNADKSKVSVGFVTKDASGYIKEYTVKGYIDIYNQGGNPVLTRSAVVNYLSDSYSWRNVTTTKYEAPADSKYAYALATKTNYSQSDIGLFTSNHDTYHYEMTNSIYQVVSRSTKMISELKTVFLIVGAVTGGLAALLLLNFISVSISSKNKDIGILRAVGARGSDVFKIFFSESSIITLICFILSAVAAGIICNYLNGQLSESMIGVKMLNYGVINILLILGVGVVISFIATFIPVLIASKKPPVEAIRAL